MANDTTISRIDLSDAKCFKAEYENHFTALKYFAMRYLPDEEKVCDLLQDIFVRLWERGEVFENEKVFKVYLYRAVRNNCLTHIRDSKRREAGMSVYETRETEESFIHSMIESEVFGLINAVFEELPPASRQVYLCSLEGKSHKEIAEELHIAVNTIKKHKNNANHYLRERLKKLLTLFF